VVIFPTSWELEEGKRMNLNYEICACVTKFICPSWFQGTGTATLHDPSPYTIHHPCTMLLNKDSRLALLWKAGVLSSNLCAVLPSILRSWGTT